MPTNKFLHSSRKSIWAAKSKQDKAVEMHEILVASRVEIRDLLIFWLWTSQKIFPFHSIVADQDYKSVIFERCPVFLQVEYTCEQSTVKKTTTFVLNFCLLDNFCS
jgi:hypothetical protein